MDEVRFDALSRTLGRLGPRRSALKALAALAAGGLSAHLGWHAAAAQQTCTVPSECDNSNPCTTASCDNEMCTQTPVPEGSECRQGKSCHNGVCRCGRPQELCNGDPFTNDCCQGADFDTATRCLDSLFGDKRCCRPTGANCTANSDCCATASLTPGCRNGACCRLPGSVCQDDNTCCGADVCRNGTCCRSEDKAITCQDTCGKVRNNCGGMVDCGCCPLRRLCDDANDCCQQFGPTECKVRGTSSQKTCCRAPGEVCGRDSECCGTGVCRGSGRNARCCEQPQGTCRRDGDCCGAAVCRNGRCCEKVGRGCDDDHDCCSVLGCFRNTCHAG